jgi:hypothetical protein
MAACVAISLYYEIPRFAMESQRAREQLLIDRGEQYKRAIQLYWAKTKRYPAKIEDLESFQNQRFLRHRYIDPMTGKDEWRLIHVSNGVLTDSLINKQGQGQQKDASISTMGQFIGQAAGLGETPAGGAGGGAINIRNRTRPSDGAIVNGPGNELPPNQPPQGFPTTGGVNAGMPPTGAVPGMNPGMTGAPGTLNITPGSNPNLNPNGTPNLPGMAQLPPGVPVPPGGVPGNYQVGVPGAPGGIPGGFPGSANRPPGLPGAPGTTGTPANSSGGFLGGGSSFVGSSGSFLGGSTTGTPTATPTYPGAVPGQPIPGQPLPGQPGTPVNSQFQGVSPTPSPYQTTPGANGTPPGFPQPGTTAGAPNNQAADLIRNILTTPRPGGMPTQAMGGQTIGAGIAGVASNSDGEGVKVYNDHSLYAEWEFIFDPAKVKQIPNPNAQGLAGTPASQMGNTQGMGGIGTPVAPAPGFNTPGFNNSGFGVPGGLQTAPGTATPRPGGRQ